MKQPYHQCPRFGICSAPRCPLDPNIDRMTWLRGEEKCKLYKARRRRLFASLPPDLQALLPYGGLFKREFNALKKWEGLSSEEREAQIARLRPFGKGFPVLSTVCRDEI